MNPTHSIPIPSLSEEDIDQQVEAQVSDDSAWEAPVYVHQEAMSVAIPGDLAAKATVLARLHQAEDVEAWIVGLIQARIELEEAAFFASK